MKDVNKGFYQTLRMVFHVCSFIVCVVFTLSSNSFALNEDVSIEWKVERPLTRRFILWQQNFRGHLRIHNNSIRIPMKHVNVTLQIFDENKNAIIKISGSLEGGDEADFQIYPLSMENVDDISGEGDITPSTVALITWNILAAQADVHTVSKGVPYFINATITYIFDGKRYMTETPQRYILVKPRPKELIDSFIEIDETFNDRFNPRQGDFLIVKRGAENFHIVVVEDIVAVEPVGLFREAKNERLFYVPEKYLRDLPFPEEPKEGYILYSLHENSYSTMEEVKTAIQGLPFKVASVIYCQSVIQFRAAHHIVAKERVGKRSDK